jgi:ribosome-associated protein
MEHSEILEQLIRSAEWTASRSSGPGGQHRDKASTRAELTLTLDGLAGLDTQTANTLAASLELDERPLRIVVQEQRSLSRNREIAIERLADLINAALAPPAPPRRPTRPSRASRERRLADKDKHSRNKTLRRPPEPDK